MHSKFQIIAFVLSLSLMLFILHLVRKERLREEFALLWLSAGICLFVMSQWNGLLRKIAVIAGVAYPPSLLFSIGIVFAVFILLMHTYVLSKLVNQTRDLAQNLAVLEWHLQQIEKHLPNRDKKDMDPAEGCTTSQEAVQGSPSAAFPS